MSSIAAKPLNQNFQMKEVHSAKKAANEGSEDSSSSISSKINTNDKSSIKSAIGRATSIDFIEKPIGMPTPFVFSLLEKLRNGSPETKVNTLINLKDALSKLPDDQLKLTRDVLVNKMAEPDNKDDELLGKVLTAVNQEVDNRNNKTIKAIGFPPPIPGGCFPPPTGWQVPEPKTPIIKIDF